MHHRRFRAGRAAAACLAIGLLVTACGDAGSDDPSNEESNPASEFCVEQGGEVDIVDEDDGQVGICVLSDGTRVDEWDYFRENGPQEADE